MLYIVFAIICAIIIMLGMLAFIFGNRNVETSRGDVSVRRGGLAIAGIGLFLLFIISVVSMVTIVEARTISVQTSFGKYVGVVKPGFHMTAPWSQFESFKTTLQPVDLNDFDNDKGDAVVVSFSAPRDPENPNQKVLAGGGNGTISAIVSYQISEDDNDATGTKAMWEKYKTFDAVSDQLVKAKAMEKIGEVANDLPANEATVNQALIGELAKVQIQEVTKRYGVIIQDVSIRRIVLDKATADSLQKIVDAINTTAAYAEQQKGSAIQNETLRQRQKAGALEEKANQRFCLDIVNSWDVVKNGPLPATFTCGLGGSANVLVGVK